jgi:digeranylgeranylglycerophospholipid reductase
MKINVIGAGPAGNYTAYLLAKKGHSVCVYEKDPVIGSPVQCTGILSDYFLTLMKPKKEFVENTIEKTRIYSPNGKFIEIKIKKNYVICRKKFDNYLADLAKKSGVNYHLNHSFAGFKKKGGKIISKINHNGKTVFSESGILIGADGPLSPVAKAAGLFKDRKFIIGTQIEARMRNDNAVEFYPYIGCYAWIVPKNKEVVRIGVAAYKNTPEIFRNFAKEKLGKDYEKKIIENQSGVIPVFNPGVKAQKDNIYLVGDAATFVKATSGGGINQSLKAAGILCESIEQEKSYEREWKKQMFINLYMHLVVHKMMQKFSNEDWNELISAFSEKKMKNILYSESRDNLVKMVLKIALTKPSLFKYVKYFSFEELKNVF